MAKVQHDDHRFSGEFMVQDSDHMSGIREVSGNARNRQAEQSQAGGGQQGADHHTGGQHGSERVRKSR